MNGIKVLGIDPGSRRTGLGVVESAGDALRLVASRCIRMENAPLNLRLGEIHRGVSEMLAQYHPQVVAVEQVFVAHNANSALALGQARGSAISAAVLAGLEVLDYTALQIKRAVVGTGSAKKEQVQHMVRVLLGLRATPSSDEADALACAICHIHTAQVADKLRRGA